MLPVSSQFIVPNHFERKISADALLFPAVTGDFSFSAGSSSLHMPSFLKIGPEMYFSLIPLSEGAGLLAFVQSL